MRAQVTTIVSTLCFCTDAVRCVRVFVYMYPEKKNTPVPQCALLSLAAMTETRGKVVFPEYVKS